MKSGILNRVSYQHISQRIFSVTFQLIRSLKFRENEMINEYLLQDNFPFLTRQPCDGSMTHCQICLM